MKNIMAIAIIIVFLSGSTNFLEAQKKRTGIALWLSIGVPALVCGAGGLLEAPPLIVVGAGVGPSSGHFYAEQWAPGLIFTGLCTATVGIAMTAAPDITHEPSSAGVFALCGITYCVVTIVNLALVPSSVNRYNRSLQIKPEIDLKEKRYSVGFVYRF